MLRSSASSIKHGRRLMIGNAMGFAIILASLFCISEAAAAPEQINDSNPKTLRAISKAGACLAEKSPDEARRLISANQDPAIVEEISTLFAQNKKCAHLEAVVNVVYFTGSMAQSLLNKGGLYISRIDAIKLDKSPEACVISRASAEIDQLFGTTWGTKQFDEVYQKLLPVSADCFAGQDAILARPAFIAARLAIYSFRRLVKK